MVFHYLCIPIRGIEEVLLQGQSMKVVHSSEKRISADSWSKWHAGGVSVGQTTDPDNNQTFSSTY